MMVRKRYIDDLAIFGGDRLFKTVKPTSNLVKPDFNKFLKYSKYFFDQKHYTNNGPNVKLLEERLADFHQTKYCVTFCNGFWALALTIKVVALEGKTEIIMPSFTYRRMADIAAWVNLKPRFCEVESDTLAMSAHTTKPCINNKTALILGVHPIVNCCDVDGLIDLSNQYSIPLVFDSVESVFESVGSGKVGCFGNIEIFSLHASKLLNGFEGGYATTNDENLAKELALVRGFGFCGPDEIITPNGINAKLNEIHAAMGLAGLDCIDMNVTHNRQCYYAYRDLLQALPSLRLLRFDERDRTSYKNIVIELLNDWQLSRSDTIKILNAENILARAYYSPPLHRKSMAYNHVPADLPLTDELSKRFLNFPCGYFVKQEDITKIVELMIFLSENASQVNDRFKRKISN